MRGRKGSAVLELLESEFGLRPYIEAGNDGSAFCLDLLVELTKLGRERTPRMANKNYLLLVMTDLESVGEGVYLD